MLPVRTLLLSDQKVDLLPQLREQIHLISRFLAALRLSAKPFSRNFGMTHVAKYSVRYCGVAWNEVISAVTPVVRYIFKPQ